MCTHIDQALRPGGITQQHVARVGSWEILVVGENARIGVDAVGCAKCRELENAESDLRHHEYRKRICAQTRQREPQHPARMRCAPT